MHISEPIRIEILKRDNGKKSPKYFNEATLFLILKALSFLVIFRSETSKLFVTLFTRRCDLFPNRVTASCTVRFVYQTKMLRWNEVDGEF